MGKQRKVGLIDCFRVYSLTLKRKSLHVTVAIYDTYDDLRSAFPHDPKAKSMMACFDVEMPPRSGRIGTLCLVRGNPMQMDKVAVHESIHAAFRLSEWKMKWAAVDWPYGTSSMDREEFIARCSDYLFSAIQKRFRDKNYYSSKRK